MPVLPSTQSMAIRLTDDSTHKRPTIRFARTRLNRHSDCLHSRDCGTVSESNLVATKCYSVDSQIDANYGSTFASLCDSAFDSKTDRCPCSNFEVLPFERCRPNYDWKWLTIDCWQTTRLYNTSWQLPAHTPCLIRIFDAVLLNVEICRCKSLSKSILYIDIDTYSANIVDRLWWTRDRVNTGIFRTLVVWSTCNGCTASLASTCRRSNSNR